MIEKPKPLNLTGLEPKSTLRAMLENTDRKDQGLSYSSPLAEIDPMTLDELVARIDSDSLALNQVPDPKDIEKLVSIYWSMREQFVLEQQLGIVSKPRKRNTSTSVITLTKTVAEMLAGEDDE